MDKIVLSGIELYGYGGVTEAERHIGQRYRIDVELELDLSAAGESDAIEDTVHYGLVYESVAAAVRETPFNLLESAASRIAGRLLDTFPVERVRVRFAKLLPPIDGIIASAAVEIERERTAAPRAIDHTNNH